MPDSATQDKMLDLGHRPKFWLSQTDYGQFSFGDVQCYRPVRLTQLNESDFNPLSLEQFHNNVCENVQI